MDLRLRLIGFLFQLRTWPNDLSSSPQTIPNRSTNELQLHRFLALAITRHDSSLLTSSGSSTLSKDGEGSVETTTGTTTNTGNLNRLVLHPFGVILLFCFCISLLALGTLVFGLGWRRWCEVQVIMGQNLMADPYRIVVKLFQKVRSSPLGPRESS